MNKVMLLGRLTKEPEKQTTTSGTTICGFTLAVDRNFTNEKGEREADFIACKIFGKIADNLCLYCHKGSQIAVEGRIQVRNYEKDGIKKYITEVICEHIAFLGNKSESKQEVQEETQVEKENDPYEDMGEQVQLEDLPFDFN